MKINYKYLLIGILIIFGVLAISSASACSPPLYDLDEGHKVFKIDHKKYHISWYAYRYSQGKNDPIMINKGYKLKNKKGKTIFNENAYYTIEKVKKNRIKVSVSYSTGPPIDKVKVYKTKLSVRAFYWRYIETQFTGKFDKRILSKEIAIDKGKFEAILPSINPNSQNITVKHSITWKAKTYTKFPHIITVTQEYSDNDTINRFAVSKIGDNSYYESYYQYITLEKTKKNRIKITIHNLQKLNGDIISDKIYTVKSNLSLKKYYLKIFKPKMIKMVF